MSLRLTHNDDGRHAQVTMHANRAKVRVFGLAMLVMDKNSNNTFP